MPDGVGVLDEVAAAGYAGIDLGPVGYLGSGDASSASAWPRASSAWPAPTSSCRTPITTRSSRRCRELDAILDTFDAVASVPGRAPTPAHAGRQRQRPRGAAGPVGPSGSPRLGLDADGWRRFGVGLAGVVARCRDRGYEPTFHPETGTYVEAPWEIERVLELTDIGLCLDTGHLLLGGGDPVAAIGAWGARINHVHLKDARRSVMAEIVADGGQATEIWSREAFPALGQGDLDVDGVLAGLRGISYRGWLVVEQDTLPRTAERFARAAADQRHNREFLARARPVSERVFRLGLIGAGRMGRTHLRALAGSDGRGDRGRRGVGRGAGARSRTGRASSRMAPSCSTARRIDGVLITAPTDHHRRS